ncbi:hypothetical protein ACN38_g9945 [Penicillium nordicum]|uniref:Uncharacterized protein n=1 Tax=Penicillium nordicum TaxID=229535 RepID=A0A0M8P2C6_9EURO|nr:hypothetical protein ACN38_g9945 [Penicillium nordicum]
MKFFEGFNGTCRNREHMVADTIGNGLSSNGAPTFDSNLNKNITTTYLNNPYSRSANMNMSFIRIPLFLSEP